MTDLFPCWRTWVRAEHSTYLTALSSRASFSPLSQVRARCLFLASFSRVLLSSLRSTWVPTSRKGVLGQWCEISGTHYVKETRRLGLTDFVTSVNTFLSHLQSENSNKISYRNQLNKPFLWRSQRRKVIRQKSRRGRHQSEGSWGVAVCRSPPDLQGQTQIRRVKNESKVVTAKKRLKIFLC